MHPKRPCGVTDIAVMDAQRASDVFPLDVFEAQELVFSTKVAVLEVVQKLPWGDRLDYAIVDASAKGLDRYRNRHSSADQDCVKGGIEKLQLAQEFQARFTHF